MLEKGLTSGNIEYIPPVPGTQGKTFSAEDLPQHDLTTPAQFFWEGCNRGITRSSLYLHVPLYRYCSSYLGTCRCRRSLMHCPRSRNSNNWPGNLRDNRKCLEKNSYSQKEYRPQHYGIPHYTSHRDLHSTYPALRSDSWGHTCKTFPSHQCCMLFLSQLGGPFD